MDQDFHYYGTYYAAKQGGFSKDDATLIAKAANFIDFFSNERYAAYWKLVSDTKKTANYHIVANLDYPRYTYQGAASIGFGPEDGLWCSYHFAPGNYADPANTPSRETVHGKNVATYLPSFQTRDTNGGKGVLGNRIFYPTQADKYLDNLRYGHLLNRPQSALSRQIIMDAIKCATDDARLESILSHAAGGKYILENNREDNLRRFRLILLGVRAHVIADTWAHQDFCGLDNVLNTYWDVDYAGGFFDGWKEQAIAYDDGTTNGWKNQVLGKAGAELGKAAEKTVIGWLTRKLGIDKNKLGLLTQNLEAVPNGTSYVGHGWMGHLPDFSFVKFHYKPCWANPKDTIIRDNPREYEFAWVELTSLFTQARGAGQLKLDEQFHTGLDKAISAIRTPFRLEDESSGRKSSANAWQRVFGDLPATNINVDAEPDPYAVLNGMIEETAHLDRYGVDYVNINSDLYLFQIAADYHFWFVKHYLEHQGIYRFTGSWSQQISALSPNILELFASSR